MSKADIKEKFWRIRTDMSDCEEFYDLDYCRSIGIIVPVYRTPEMCPCGLTCQLDEECEDIGCCSDIFDAMNEKMHSTTH